MPKPDASKDYYGILDVKTDAGPDEIKKAYHKLAFKWHPDRNHGNEAEAATKFQDVSNAYEILIEPTTRTKYDNERAKNIRKNTTPLTSPTNPYNPYANFPPARPAQQPYRSPTAGGPGGAQYTQYTTQTSAPWAQAGTQARTRVNPQEDWRAWNQMKTKPSSNSTAPPPPRGPPHPPRPKATAAYAQFSGGPSPKSRAGWSEPDDPPRSHASDGGNRPAPGLARANTMRMPKKGGFNPVDARNDEPQARNTSAYYNVKARSSRPQSFVHPTSPLPNGSPPRSRPASQGFRQTSSDENFGDRLSTPYSTGGGEKTYFSSAQLYRDAQLDSNSNLSAGWEREGRSPRDSRNRHRSASPRISSPRTDTRHSHVRRDSETSSSTSSSEDEVLRRPTLRPKSYKDRQQPMPPPPPPMATQDRSAAPGLTVENEHGKVHEFSKPGRSSTWGHESSDMKNSSQRLADESNGSRRISTGNIKEQQQPQQHFSPQPSPLQNTTSTENDFEPLEKSVSWQQKYGSPPDTTHQRHFDPPPNGSNKPKYDLFPSHVMFRMRALDGLFKSQAIDAAQKRKRSITRAQRQTHLADTTSSLSSANANDSTEPTKVAKNDDSYFHSQKWAERFSSAAPNVFSPQNIPRHGSPVKGKGNNLRVPRKNSVPRKQNPARSARIGSDADSVPSMSSSTESVSSGNAMDIDTKTPPPTAAPTAKIPQVHPQRVADQHGSLNMSDLGQTAPFAPSNNAGLGDMGDLGATLPFDSKAATTLPTDGVHVHRLILPQPPRPPKSPRPEAMRKEDWEYYLVFIRKYMAEWNIFNRQMLNHFEARQQNVENDLPKGWLEGIGETGLSKYMSWLQEDDRVRQHWDVAYSKHTRFMADFQTVKKLASSARFVNH